MAVSRDIVRLYLRIDPGIEDVLLDQEINSTSAALRAAVPDFDLRYDASADFKAMADQAQLYMIADLYENRLPGKGINDYSYTIRSHILHLQCWQDAT